MKYAIFCLLLLVMAVGFRYPARNITGTVSDEMGNPVVNASVIVKGTNIGGVTGKDGSFSLVIADEKVVLVVSSVGFETQEIKLGKSSQLKIVLKISKQALHEVLVAGNGRASKKDMDLTVANLPNVSLQSGRLLGSAGGIQIRGNGIVGNNRIYKPWERVSMDREGYDNITDNTFAKVTDHPLSTFSIDVDAASYSNVRRILKEGQLPQAGAVRIEEMINYFRYDYKQPTGDAPFAVNMELGVCPWNTKHQLAMIGLQGKKIDMEKLPPSNLTFLVDVSGSMSSADKLPLVRESLKLLAEQLREEDKVSIVVYAGNAGLVLPPTSGDQKMRIKEAIEQLEAGGSTAGGAGIQLAYKTARENFNAKGNNRVILCTDGDFNVGVSSDDALERMIEEERKSGVFLTVLGFGTGNYQDAKMQKMADKGNGNHSYIDQLSEAKKVLVSEFGGTLFTIAKDVKLQVEFNPAKVKGYRLIGYENRMLAKEDFNNDKKDAGELGSGHTVTALYEIVPVGVDMPENNSVDSLRYQTNLNAKTTEQAKFAEEILNVKLRYKQPDGDNSKLVSYPLKTNVQPVSELSENFRFAAAVASFGMLLRNSEHKGKSSYDAVLSLARNSLGKDEEGYRKEFLQLVSKAYDINKRKDWAKEE